MNEQDIWTLDAMEEQGGSFVKALANAARHADPVNFQKIKDTWPDYWKDYERRGVAMREAAEAKDEDEL